MKKRILSGVLAFAMVIGMGTQAPQAVKAADTGITEIELSKSTQGNPIAGFDDNGDILYAGDPSILVDGDTVYLYVGHDNAAAGSSYTMPRYFCYSTKDMKSWKYEGIIMEMSSVKWADNVSAWASQVIKYQNKYYLLYCAEKTGGKGKAVGYAVSDSPTEGFVDGGILIEPDQTNTKNYYLEDGQTVKEKYNQNKHHNGESFGWEDIDPTAWIEPAECSKDGREHVYMAWGNTYPWMCELEIDGDYVDVKDQNGDNAITQGIDNDLWYQDISGIESIASNGNTNDMVTFTEAPYLYRRQDENGKYYGDYYLFYATHWREEMGYATTSDITSNKWTHRGNIMEPTATSNTNHPAVFDFKGHTYFIYHNGSLPGGMGQRRVICVEELVFNEDGSIPYIQETSCGLTGFSNKILDSTGAPVAHDHFNNTLLDADYPISGSKAKGVSINKDADENDMMWEIEEGKADRNKKSYVTIESYNKPGTYLTVVKSNNAYDVVLAHDDNGDKKCDSDGKTAESDSMTFRTLAGFSGEAGSVTFESVAYPGYYLASVDNDLVVTDNPDKAAASFKITDWMTTLSAQKTRTTYEIGEKVKDDDIRVKAGFADGTTKTIQNGFTTNAAEIDTSKAGKKKLTLTYTYSGDTLTTDIEIEVIDTRVYADHVTLSANSLKLCTKKSDGLKTTATLSAELDVDDAPKTISWKSSNPSVANVSKGKITAKKAGTAVITATAVGGAKATCKVTVLGIPSKISVNKTNVSLKKGKTFQIKASVPKNCICKTFKYKSNKTSVATVSKSGKITARKKGTAKITVTAGNNSKAKKTITVKVK